MKTRSTIVLALVCVAPLAACEKKQPAPAAVPTQAAPAQPNAAQPAATTPAPATAPAATAASPAPTQPAASTEIRAGGLGFTLPAKWESRKPSNNMRLAEARLAGAAADGSQDCVVAWFQTGGSVEDNMTRWKGMVTKADGAPADAVVEVIEVQGVKVHTVELVGAYVEGGMSGGGTRRENWMFRGAIIETPGQLSFVRMTGPADIMATQRDAWGSIIRSMK
jgi:hypothetical protein